MRKSYNKDINNYVKLSDDHKNIDTERFNDHK